MSDEKLGFGYYDDTSDDLKSKGGGKFGLNSPAFCTKMELNKNAGKDGSLADAIDITIQIVDREYNQRIYPVTRVYNKAGDEMKPEDAGYVAAYNAEWSQKNAVLIHLLKCYRTEEEIKTALNVPLSSFVDFAEVICGLLPTNSKEIPLDVFLEWQWTINDNQDRTFLQLPKNMKGGYFIVKQQVANGAWKEIRTEKGLKYMDANNAEHPFMRDANYMDSNKGHQQVEGEEAATAILQGAANADEGKW